MGACRRSDQDGHRDRHHRPDRAVRQRRLAGRAVHGRGDQQGGGILGQPIELYLEDTASDPKIAVGNVRRLIQERKVDVVLGGITSAMRQAIKDPIVNRGRTLYIYPQLYEGQECTKNLFCTGPTPAQQCDKLIPYLIKTVGKKRFAMPSANYVWPQLLNKYARKVIEANGGEVVFEEYYPLDQAEYSATIGKIRDGKVDCVFNTVIPPGLQPFVKQLYESGFQKNGGVLTCVYFDENMLNYLPAQEMEGLYSCLDYFQAVDDPFSKKLQTTTRRSSPTPSTCSPPAGRRPACIAASSSTRPPSRRPTATCSRCGRGRDGQGEDRPGSGRRRRDGAGQDALQDEHVHRAVCKVDAGKTPLRGDQQAPRWWIPRSAERSRTRPEPSAPVQRRRRTRSVRLRPPAAGIEGVSCRARLLVAAVPAGATDPI